jgi:hypothetical protein
MPPDEKFKGSIIPGADEPIEEFRIGRPTGVRHLNRGPEVANSCFGRGPFHI